MLVFCLQISFILFPFAPFPSWFSEEESHLPIYPSGSSEEISLDVQHPLLFLLIHLIICFCIRSPGDLVPFKSSSSIHPQFFSLQVTSLLSGFCPSVAIEVQTTSPPKMPTMTHPYKAADLPTPQNITTIVHWLVSRLSSPMLDLVKVTEIVLYQHGPLLQLDSRAPETRSHVTSTHTTKHPSWALETGDYGLSRVATIRKSPTEFMIAETKRRQRPSLNPSDLLRILPNHS